MKIVDVKLCDEVKSLLEQIFGESSPEYLRYHEDEYLLYLLEHLAHALSGKSSCRIFSNHQTPNEQFKKELQGLVQRVATSGHNIIAHRIHFSDGPAIEVD